MTDKLEYEGWWWLPENPDAQIPGTLSFEPTRGAFLRLMDSFGERRVTPLTYELVLGISIGGDEVTLYNCREIKLTPPVFLFTPSTIGCEYLLVGSHFYRVEDIIFEKVKVHYSHLDEWVNVSGFDRESLFNTLDNLMAQGEFTINYTYPKLPNSKVIVDNLAEISIDLTVRFPTLTIVQKEVLIKQIAGINIKLLQEKEILAYQVMIEKIQKFLSLGVLRPVYPVSIKGFLLEDSSSSKLKSVSIYYQVPNIPIVDSDIFPHNMLFNFSDLVEKFDSCLRNWFHKYELLEPTFKIYFGIIHTPKTNRMDELLFTNQFLNLMQAIESYHSRRYGEEGQYQLDDKYYNGLYPELTNFLNSLPTDVIDEQFKNNLIKNSFKYLHHHSLRKRMKDIFNRFKNVISTKISQQDINTLIGKAVDTRNYYTHLGEISKNVIKSDRELYELSRKLKFLIEVCFLYELEILGEEIKVIILRNNDYQFIK